MGEDAENQTLAGLVLADAKIFDLNFFAVIRVIAFGASAAEITPIHRSIASRFRAERCAVGFVGGVEEEGNTVATSSMDRTDAMKQCPVLIESYILSLVLLYRMH